MNEKKEPVFVHCSECRHEWPAFYLPQTLNEAGMRIIKSLGRIICPMCGGEKIFMGKAVIEPKEGT